jgi:hypothetical protein
VLRTGSVDARFTAVNFVTLMFTMERGRDILEVSPCNPDQTLNGRYHTSSSFYEMRVHMWFRTWDSRCLPRADGTCVACHSSLLKCL